MIASQYGDNIYATRLVFRGNVPLYLLPTLIPFCSPSTPRPYLLYSSQYKSTQFSIFTTCPIPSFLSVSPNSIPSNLPFIICFVTSTEVSQIVSNIEIVDIIPSPLDPTLYPSLDLFDGWFGTPFLDKDQIIHVRSPHISEISSLYNLSPSIVHSLSPLPSPLTSFICINIFPFHTAKALASFIISNDFFPSCKFVNNSLVQSNHCFTLHSTPTNSTWKATYATDEDAKKIILSLANEETLTINTLTTLNVSYKHGIFNKIFRILEDKLIYYGKTLTSTSYILRIVVPSSLRCDLFPLSTIHLLVIIWGNIRIYIVLTSGSSSHI